MELYQLECLVRELEETVQTLQNSIENLQFEVNKLTERAYFEDISKDITPYD